MSDVVATDRERHLPKWVPLAARHYLAHTEDGLSIRALARATNSHPSTILRQVRRFEGRRDDPLIDAALKALAEQSKTKTPKVAKGDDPNRLSQERIDQEAKRILRRMCEPRAVLAVAHEIDSAVVVREDEDGEPVRTATVDREIAQAMALKGWITCPAEAGRVRRYAITNAGRAALRQLTAADENRAQGLSANPATPDGEVIKWDFPMEADGMRNRARYYATESPLIALSRRRDKDGLPFLSAELVKAGESLREDFELAQISGPAARDCAQLIALSLATPKDNAIPKATLDARDRLAAALTDLGPGLGDVALRCCCLLEGLEVTEKKLGWSARSGKIVLRIALQRLRLHYEETRGKYAPMIG